MSLEERCFSDLSQADVAALNRVIAKVTTRLETIAATAARAGD
jgi:hypothetical protein